MSDYVEEFRRLGFAASVARFRKRVNLSEIETLISNSTCSSLMKNALLKLISSRVKELDHALLHD